MVSPPPQGKRSKIGAGQPGAIIPRAHVHAQLRNGFGGEIGELEFDDRLPAHLRGPQRETHYRRFAQRHVYNPIRSVPIDQSFARFKGRTIAADVQSEQESVGMPGQQIIQCAIDRLAVFYLRGLIRLDVRSARQGHKESRIASAGRAVRRASAASSAD